MLRNSVTLQAHHENGVNQSDHSKEMKMTNLYFHHCAACATIGAKPLSYPAWVALVNAIEVTA